jgi:predicted alpha-1,2-mannosidase
MLAFSAAWDMADKNEVDVMSERTIRTGKSRKWIRAVLILLGVGVAMMAPAWMGKARAGETQDPVSLVDPFTGTSGTKTGGPIDTFPGATMPFGMIAWSPDTPSQPAGGGYDYADKDITGFSLTHLSGPGCSVFGDIGILPTTGTIRDPGKAKRPFPHASEQASPGWYAVTVGKPGTRVELAVTERSGLGRFKFPTTGKANLLFNVSSDQAGVTGATVRVAGRRELVGSATSGSFCGMPDRFTVYFVAQFNRDFNSFGMWRDGRLSPGSRMGKGPGTGAWVRFDARHDRSVEVRVAISYVNVAGAEANLEAEGKTWNLEEVRGRARGAWERLLERLTVEGGTKQERETFYTAVYHSLLSPNIYSDVTGLYRGFDGKVHHVAAGHVEYANYSGWDIYRSLTPLQALLAPRRESDMMQSLVDSARQGGWLPKWALANGYTAVMGGDSADPIIAGAYAFGARDFDLRGALTAMAKGASDTTSPPGQGWYVERPGLAEYLKRGYVVNVHTTSVSPVPNGASVTLEYALDDFSIAEFAKAIGNEADYHKFLKQSEDWATLFNTAMGEIAPRGPSGAFQKNPITENGQSGFQEGNAAQYTWMVPQDLRDLARGMGGRAATRKRLDTFFSKLNSGQSEPYAWLGNEPSLGSPWTYLSVGAPWRTQEIVRQAITTLYNTTPAGLPGNDDLGAMSSWYVWCAMGLYPQNPAVRVLDVGSPLFREVRLDSPSGVTIEIHAPGASDSRPYVHGLRVNGKTTQHTWVALPEQGTLRLDFALVAKPDMHWGTASVDAPPSFSEGKITFPPATKASLGLASRTLAIAPGGSAELKLDATNEGGDGPVRVKWKAVAPKELSVRPSSGATVARAGETTGISVRVSTGDDLAAGYFNVRFEGTEANRAVLEPVTAVVRVAHGEQRIPLAYVVNMRGNSVTPVDLSAEATGIPIAAGKRPVDAVVGRAGKRFYVVDAGDDTVLAIDPMNERVVGRVKVGRYPTSIAIAPDGKTLWVANGRDDNVQPIDTATLKAGKPIGVGRFPVQVVVARDGGMLYAVDAGSNSVTPVNLRTRTEEKAIPVGPRPSGAAITQDGRRMYVTDSGSNSVTPIDLRSRRVLPAIPVGVRPRAIAIAPNSRTVWVANSGTNTIMPIDTATGRAGTPIAVGGHPAGIVFTRNGEKAFVVVLEDNACVPVDLRSRTVGKPIRVGDVPVTMAAPAHAIH